MDSLASLYKNHIVTLQERTRDVLARFKLDALLIHSGELMNTFRMTMRIRLRLTRSLKPGAGNTGAKLLVAGGWREQAETVVLSACGLLAQR